MSTPNANPVAPLGHTFIRAKYLKAKDGLATSTRCKLISEGKYPRPVKLGPRMSAFIESEVDAWMAERIAQRDRPATPRPRRDQSVSAG